MWLWEFSLPFFSSPQTFWITCTECRIKNAKETPENQSGGLTQRQFQYHWNLSFDSVRLNTSVQTERNAAARAHDTCVHRVISCQTLILKIWKKKYVPKTFRRIPVALLKTRTQTEVCHASTHNLKFFLRFIFVHKWLSQSLKKKSLSSL